MHACTLLHVFTFTKDGKAVEKISFKAKCMPGKDIDTSSEKLTEAYAKKQTIGPLQTIGASLSTRNPMDIHRTPWFSTGIIFMSVKKGDNYSRPTDTWKTYAKMASKNICTAINKFR